MEARVLTHHVLGRGEPLVLVPGGLTGWLSWIPHQERLSDHHQVTRVQPIHNELGSAGRPGDPGYSAEVERDSLLLTLNELEMEEADFAGWSSGARALLEFAMTYPERVRSLTLVEPPAYWILRQLDEADSGVEELGRFLADRAGADITAEDLARFLSGAGFGSDAARLRAHPAWDSWMSHRMALSWQGFIHPRRGVQDLSNITCPVLLVKGTATAPWQARVVDVLGDRLASAKTIELEGSHACHIESMDAFLEGLESHLH